MAASKASQLSDFRNTVFIIWRHLGLPVPTWLQYDMAHWMQHGPKRLFIAGFRGVAKSYLASAFVVHELNRDPDKKILVVSATQTRADDFVIFTQRLIKEIPQFQHLRSRDDQRNSRISFDVGPATAAHSPSVKSVGIFGQLAGSRADLIIPDDIEIPNNSLTQGQRDKLAEAIKEFEAVLKPKGRILYLGTYQSEQSTYMRLPERGYQVRVWPARYPNEKQRANYQEFLAPALEEKLEADPSLEGAPTDPIRFDDIDLQEREASYGKAGFSLQFMLDTSLADADRYPLKLSDFSVMDLDYEVAPEKVVWASGPQVAIDNLPNPGLAGDRWNSPMQLLGSMLPYQGVVMGVDPSGRGKDETGYACVGYLNGQLYLLESGGFTEGYTVETMEALARAAKRCKVTRIVDEGNYGGGMFTELLKPVLARIHPCQMETVTAGQVSKEKRIIDTLEPVLQQHRLTVSRAVIQGDMRMKGEETQTQPQYQLFYQLTRLTRDKGSLRHDDRLDALALAVGDWVDSMARDASRELDSRRGDLMDAELARLEGKDPKELNNWFASSLFRLPR